MLLHAADNLCHDRPRVWQYLTPIDQDHPTESCDIKSQYLRLQDLAVGLKDAVYQASGHCLAQSLPYVHMRVCTRDLNDLHTQIFFVGLPNEPHEQPTLLLWW